MVESNPPPSEEEGGGGGGGGRHLLPKPSIILGNIILYIVSKWEISNRRQFFCQAKGMASEFFCMLHAIPYL